jgi:hypothetical protein
MALFVAEVGNVYDGNGVGGNEPQRLAGFETVQALAGFEHRKRAQEAGGIDVVVHGRTI